MARSGEGSSSAGSCSAGSIVTFELSMEDSSLLGDLDEILMQQLLKILALRAMTSVTIASLVKQGRV